MRRATAAVRALKMFARPFSGASSAENNNRRVGEALAYAKAKRVPVTMDTSFDRPGSVVASALPVTEEDAYAVQGEFLDRATRKYNLSVAGWKVGATNGAAMQRLGLVAPFAGPLFASDIIQAPARVDISYLGLRGVEAEFVYELGEDLPAKEDDYTVAELSRAVRWVYPAVELVGSRFPPGTAIGTHTLIADQAGGGALVVAPQLRRSLAEFEAMGFLPVRMLVNDAVVGAGSAADVLRNPIYSITWLANSLKARHLSLKKGDIVSTGTMTGKADAKSGDVLLGEFEGIGQVRVHLR